MNDAILDASVVVQLLFPERNSTKARMLIEDAIRGSVGLFGPPILTSEIVNVIRQRMRRERLPISRGIGLLHTYFNYSVAILEPANFYQRTLETAERYGISAFDAQYVALASMRGIDLWTDDERLLRALGGRVPEARWIGDYGASAPR